MNQTEKQLVVTAIALEMAIQGFAAVSGFMEVEPFRTNIWKEALFEFDKLTPGQKEKILKAQIAKVKTSSG